MNYRLALEQNSVIDQINKFSDTYKSDENEALRHIKNIKEDIQRQTLQIVEKERIVDGIVEKYTTYAKKIE